MNKFYRNAALAAITFISLVACGNAGAKNDKRSDDSKKAVIELNTDQFNTKVYDMSKEDKW